MLAFALPAIHVWVWPTDLALAANGGVHGKPVINLGIGQPDFATPDHIVEAAIKALKDGHHGYTDARGIPAVREGVARYTHERTGVEISPDNVLIVPGGKVTMFAAILMFGEPGADILYPDPGFPIYRSMIEFTGAQPIPIPITQENGFAFKAEDVLARITPSTRLIIVNSPANPTGGVTPKTEIDALVQGLEAHPHVAILSDEIYERMTYDADGPTDNHVSLLTYPQIRDRLIILNGWSKTWAMTGWRMGWSIWPDELYDKARKLAVNAWSCVNAPAQWAGLAALDGPQDAVDEMMSAFAARRRLVVDGLNALPSISCIEPEGAFYAFPDISRTGWQAKPLANTLLDETGVALIGGPDFGVLGEGFIRVSYAASSEQIEEALGRMKTFLER
eukprot:g17611.t1